MGWNTRLYVSTFVPCGFTCPTAVQVASIYDNPYDLAISTARVGKEPRGLAGTYLDWAWVLSRRFGARTDSKLLS